MRIIDKESNSGKIIRALGMGVGIAVALSNKRTSYRVSKALLKEIFGPREKPKNVSSYFSRLRKQKFIDFEKDGNFHKIILAEKGREVLLRFNYENMDIKIPKIWDRNFRVIVFDIPEKKKSARDSLREKIKELGCIRFNDSVWVSPYPCQKEIDFIANYWDVGKYIHFILARDITNRDLLEKSFDL